MKHCHLNRFTGLISSLEFGGRRAIKNAFVYETQVTEARISIASVLARAVVIILYSADLFADSDSNTF